MKPAAMKQPCGKVQERQAALQQTGLVHFHLTCALIFLLFDSATFHSKPSLHPASFCVILHVLILLDVLICFAVVPKL